MKIDRMTRLQTTIGQIHSPFLFSSCMYHQDPGTSGRRSILDNLAMIILLSTCAFASPLFLFTNLIYN